MWLKSLKIRMLCLETSKKGPILSDKRLLRDLKQLLNIFEKEFKFKGIGQIELSLTLCGRKKIKSLNRNYRNKNKETDVLSFPVHENLRKGNKAIGHLELGDIFICREVAKKQAQNFNISEREEILHLFVHGFLHLLGYDHEISKKEELLMFSKERKLLSKIKKRK